MSAAQYPIQVCDAEDGCDAWELDVRATGARIVSGRDPLAGWAVDRARDEAYCPEHARVGRA